MPPPLFKKEGIMPYYNFLCECGNYFDEQYSINVDSAVSQCPECNRMAKKYISGIGVIGLTKQVKYANRRHQVELLRPRPYEDSLSQLQRIEDSGKMTPELRRHANSVLSGLKAERDAGKHNADFWNSGHPLEKHDEPREGVLD